MKTSIFTILLAAVMAWPLINGQSLNAAEKVSITFSAGSYDNAGTLPKSDSAELGGSYVLPLNRQLYVEGKTLTAWSDGDTTYAPNKTITIEKAMVFTPVFTDNTVSLDDRDTAVVIRWDFQKKNGAPNLGIEGYKSFYVTQALVKDKTIDVKMNFDTSHGKVNNGNWSDWCQFNAGTIFTLPSALGAEVSMEAYNNITTTTIDGSTDYTQAKTISYTVENTTPSVDVVIGDGSYYRYIQVVIPAIKGKVNQVATSFSWPFSEGIVGSADKPGEIGAHEATLSHADYVNQHYISLGMGLYENGTGTGTADFIQTKINPATSESAASESNALKFMIKLKTGLTFKPTKVSFNTTRYGTDGGFLDVSWQKGNGQLVKLGSGISPMRNNKNMDKTPNALTAVSYVLDTISAVEGECGLVINMYNLGATKQIGFDHIVIEGLVDGKIADVKTYRLAVSANPIEAGTVKNTPVGKSFDENTEIVLKQTRNFGYQFVHWTDSMGNILSTEEDYTFNITADTQVVAQYEAINTYALNVETTSGAAAYMISFDPAPQIIDGKNMYEQNDKVTLTASENPILTFASWNSGETSGSIVLTMDSNINIVANYNAIDYIAGWDFYNIGGNGRPADFAAADNDADALVLRTAEGSVAGWLDKSQLAAGGYEGMPAAVNWKPLAEKWYYQTKVNASAFTDIFVQSKMLYNYNAYTVQRLEYSFNDTTWIEVSRDTLKGSKSWTDVSAKLPQECNNRPAIYLRWIPDYSSAIAGSTSDNDGTSLSEIYVLGTAKPMDDGKAPRLLSTVPQENAQSASISGKIVLNFDEKVRLNEGAVANLGSLVLPLEAKGKTVSATYKGLNYASNYTFTLPANSISDLTDSAYAQAITIHFTTKTKAPVDKGGFDFIVPDDGTFRDAIKAASSRPNTAVRYRIFVKKGSYLIPGDDGTTVLGSDNNSYKKPTTSINTPNISIIGEDMDKTVLYNTHEAFNLIEGLGKAEFINLGSNTKNAYVQDITFKNGHKLGDGRCPALQDQGDKNIFKNFRMWGTQDTYLSNNQNGRFYFEGGALHGSVDYLCGKGDVVYNGCDLVIERDGSVLCAPSQAKTYGYVFLDCTVKSANPEQYKTYSLGRPWGAGTPGAIFINLTMTIQASADGWSEMSGGYPMRFAEYGTKTASGTFVDLSKRKTTFGEGHPNNPILSADEAAQYSIAQVMGSNDDWDPTAYTEQASMPTNLRVEGKNLVWDNNDYVLCWAIVKNDSVVAFSNEPTYAIDDEEALYAVRAANEMGGLSEATPAIGLSMNQISSSASIVLTRYFSVAGIESSAPMEGINIVRHLMSDGSVVINKLLFKRSY